MELLELEQSKSKNTRGIFLRSIKLEFTLPVFMGVFCSLVLCLLAGVYFGVFKNITEPEINFKAENEEETGNFLLLKTEITHNSILEYFHDPEYRQWVMDFFSNICINQEVVLAILENSEKFNVPPALAFAVCWEESRFNPNAVNRYNHDESIDRGLFQLNSRSFPNLDNAGFFDIKNNVYYGIGHLKYCLDVGGSEVSALAMYNAGTGRVRTYGAPEVTLNYISRILDNKSKIENQFNMRLNKKEEIRIAEARLAEKAERDIKIFQPLLNRTFISTSPL